MPLAPAHPAVVLPLQRLGLPLSALVAGAVAPDAAVYLPVPVSYSTTHSGPGLVVDVVIGLVVLWLWDVLIRRALVDLTPALRTRTTTPQRLDRRAWALAPIAVAIGAATHVLWDSVTHDWGFIVEALPVLRDDYGPLPLYSWLQHLSTVLGTTVVVAYGARRLRRRPVLHQRPSAVRRPALWLALVPLAALVVGLLLRDLNAAVGAGLLAVVAVAVGWRLASS